MRRRFFLLLWISFWCLPPSSLAQTPPHRLEGERERVNAMYREGKFEESISAYMKLISSDPGNPYLHYNLGNAYFKSNRTGRAVVSYMRAYRLLPRDTDIRYNLNFILNRSGEKLVPAGIPAVVHLAYYFLSENELKGLNWLLLWIVLIGACVYVTSDALRPALKTPLISAGILWCVLALWWVLRLLTAVPGAAVIVDGTAEIRNGPGENFSPSATVPEGRIVRIMDVKENWSEIGIPKEGIKGWVKSSSVEKI